MKKETDPKFILSLNYDNYYNLVDKLNSGRIRPSHEIIEDCCKPFGGFESLIENFGATEISKVMIAAMETSANQQKRILNAAIQKAEIIIRDAYSKAVSEQANGIANHDTPDFFVSKLKEFVNELMAGDK